MDMKKRVLVLVLSGVLLVAVSGCNLVEGIFALVAPGSILNLAQLGQTDIAGQRNMFMPAYPDYASDPTCIIPGFCGGNPWFPFSTGETGGT